MKKLVSSAIALSMTATAGLATGDWSSLDQQIEALTASTALDTTGPTIGGRVRTLYVTYEYDVLEEKSLSVDVGGFRVNDARFHVTGGRNGYDYKVQVDFADGDPIILDAYAGFPIGGQVKGRIGKFKPAIARSGLVSSGKLFFVDRSIVGNLFSGRTAGFMVHGEADQLGWWITVSNGTDGVDDDYLISGRLTFDVLGEGVAGCEGAYGGTDEPSATVAVAFYDDGFVDDGDGTLLEFHGGTNVYSFGLDVLDVGEGLVTSNGSAMAEDFGTTISADCTPITAWGTYMLQPEAWEVGVRMADYDNELDEDKLDVAVTNYLDGHNLKWSLQYSTTSSDDSANEVDWIGLQVQVGF